MRTEDKKSRGHIAFGKDVEFYDQGGEVFMAPRYQGINDVVHGTRHGSWEASREFFDSHREHWGLRPIRKSALRAGDVVAVTRFTATTFGRVYGVEKTGPAIPRDARAVVVQTSGRRVLVRYPIDAAESWTYWVDRGQVDLVDRPRAAKTNAAGGYSLSTGARSRSRAGAHRRSRTRGHIGASVYPGPQIFHLAKGLDRQEAYRRARERATRDFRGFDYDARMGVAKLI